MDVSQRVKGDDAHDVEYRFRYSRREGVDATL